MPEISNETGGLEAWKPKTELETEPKQPVVLSTAAEQLSVFRAIYTALARDTKHEIAGHLKDEGINDNNVLRGVLKQLGTNLGKDKQLQPEEWLHVGVTDFIPEDKLHEWAHPSAEPHWTEKDFHQAAQYFEQKKQATSSE